ncbi:uncharacterized protein LOC105186457 [Harpegnathos saltator]|uniref:THAP-type domain-containing protein n=1 Tax=Harpegnathos saltator TaxID=610380 RepID=E2B538_HARSA|nr:uncharacterized protein LOC105186457 [Harpegnathos saltator]EFN89192.1 hypothetical protein EAI_11128 [Harpegnathos saltator]
MVRVCCVPECSTGKTAPSHKFPRNAERRLQWFKNLKMEPVEGSEEKKLRVCYNHFRDSDYNCSFKLRVLLSDAVPSINVPSNDETCHLMQNNVETASDVAQEMQEGTGKTYINEKNAQLDELEAVQQRLTLAELRYNTTKHCCCMRKH